MFHKNAFAIQKFCRPCAKVGDKILRIEGGDQDSKNQIAISLKLKLAWSKIGRREA